MRAALGEEAGRTSRSHSSRMRTAPLTAESLLLLEPRRERRQDPRGALFLFLFVCLFRKLIAVFVDGLLHLEIGKHLLWRPCCHAHT